MVTGPHGEDSEFEDWDCIGSPKSLPARMGARSHFVSLLVEFDPVAGLNWCLGRGRVGQDLGEVLEAFPG